MLHVCSSYICGQKCRENVFARQININLDEYKFAKNIISHFSEAKWNVSLKG